MDKANLSVLILAILTAIWGFFVGNWTISQGTLDIIIDAVQQVTEVQVEEASGIETMTWDVE